MNRLSFLVTANSLVTSPISRMWLMRHCGLAKLMALRAWYSTAEPAAALLSTKLQIYSEKSPAEKSGRNIGTLVQETFATRRQISRLLGKYSAMHHSYISKRACSGRGNGMPAPTRGVKV